MKNYCLLFFFLTFSSFGQNCSMLKDGKYEIRYNDQLTGYEKFEIIGDKYYYYENGVKQEIKIKLIDSCTFQFINEDIVDESKLTELQILLRNQKIYFEIVKVEETGYFFICRVDLHIICGNGKFVKLED